MWIYPSVLLVIRSFVFGHSYKCIIIYLPVLCLVRSWLCGEATGRSHTYTSIDGHSCGRYKEETKVKTERAKKDLFRYIHYHNRYKAHMDSLNLETKLQTTMQEKISVLE